MAELSPKLIHEVNAVLLASVQLPLPYELTKVPEQHDLALEENAVLEKAKTSLGRKLDASQKENKSLRQKLDASQNENKSRGQKLTEAWKEKKLHGQRFDASQKDNELLGQRLDASEKENKLLGQRLHASEKENKLLGQRLHASEKENKLLGQRLDASEKENKLLGQRLDASEKENKLLGQRLDAFHFMVGMRQIFSDFRNKHGKAIDEKLMSLARDFFKSDFGNSHIECFSGQVIFLVNQRIGLTEALNRRLLNSDRWKFERQIKAVNRKLDNLKTVAAGFTTSEMEWSEPVGKGIFTWCSLIRDANKVCHRDMTREFLDAMRGHAERKECIHDGIEFGAAVTAVIAKLWEGLHS